jgi:hypothetical protein
MSILYNNHTIYSKNSKKGGKGLVNTLINRLPFELHLPGYHFCGPGTKLTKRLERGDKGINLLDEACKEHDIAYSQTNDIKGRHAADKILGERALARLQAKDATFGEKAAALGISGAMKIKRKLGMGLKKKLPRKIVRGRGISLSQAISKARKSVRGKKFRSLNASIRSALKSIKNRKVLPPKRRIIPIPKSGGFLPLIPLFAGLSALGALGGGAAGIAKAVNDAKAAQKTLDEATRHNKTMEEIAIGKKGSGLYLKPYKTGCGLYLKPYSKNC